MRFGAADVPARPRPSGLAGDGKEDGVAAAVLDGAGGGVEAEAVETGGGELLGEDDPVETKMENAIGVAVERTVFGVEVGKGEMPAGREQRTQMA